MSSVENVEGRDYFPANSLAPSAIVRSNARVSLDSVFSDGTWNMSSCVTTPGVGSGPKQWSYEAVPGFPGGFALSLAEYAYARLNNPCVSEVENVAWLSVRQELEVLTEFARFCSGQGFISFSQLNQSLFYQYLKGLQFGALGVNKKSDARIRTIFLYIYRFWEHSAAVGEPIVDIPLGRPFNKVFKKSGGINSGENKTPVIPENVYASIMNYALGYVLDYSPVILEAWMALKNTWDVEIAPLHLSGSGKTKRLVVAASKLLSSRSSRWRRRAWTTYGDVYDELQQLRVACMLTLLAYSGIRCSELLAIEAGCCVSDNADDGSLIHFINTKVHKHRERGAKDTWVVIEEVVTAVEILEVLTERARLETGCNLLMITDRKNAFFSVHKSFVGNFVSEIGSGGIIAQINRFRDYCNANLVGDGIPGWVNEDGLTKPWKFNTRQFRRTLARYIARQPFGVIAGMLQYKHVEIATFQGYAGSEPEWNKLLADEKVLASIDVLEEVAMDLSNGELAGNIGQKLKEQFSVEFKGRAEDFPPSQIAKWLANAAKPLFVGKFNFCFFDPTKAVCTSSQADAPVLNHCQPEVCGNACIGKRHISKWEAQLKQAEELANHPKASRIHRQVMSSEIAKLRSVVDNYGRKP